MAEVEEPQFNSLAERIAALNKQNNFSSSPQPAAPSRASSSATTTTTQGHRPPPPPPPGKKPVLPPPPAAPNPVVRNGAPSAVPPPLPRRASQPAQTVQTTAPSPTVPPRRASAHHLQQPSNAIARRDSFESVVSHLSNTAPSSTSLSHMSSKTSLSSNERRKLPPAFGTTKIPPQPLTRKEREAKEREAAQREAPERGVARRETIGQREAEWDAAEEREGDRDDVSDLPSKSSPRPSVLKRLSSFGRKSKEPEEDYSTPQLPRRPARRAPDQIEEEEAPRLPRRPAASRPSEPEEKFSGPRLPPRPRPSPQDRDQPERPSKPGLPDRQPASARAAQSILDMGFNNAKSQPSQQNRDSRNGREGIKMVDNERRRRNDDDDDDDEPPPLPMTSRPSRAQVEAVVGNGKGNGNGYRNGDRNGNRNGYGDGYDNDRRDGGRGGPRRGEYPGSGDPRFYPKRSEDEECLFCRDFSGPDEVAAQYPRDSLPRQNTVKYLAHHLCDQFDSETDKARAIFTWSHHNIVYDTHGLFNNCIPRGLSISEQIFSGKAVCEGYAKIYQAVAQAAGLECIVVCGHGKGYGFNRVRRGDPVPPAKPTGHAWNAVRIDGGEWKLLDSCWGAGALCNGVYSQRFEPAQFAKSNEAFGERHFPENPNHFFRADGRRPSWAEYIVDKVDGDPVVLFENPQSGIAEEAIEPRTKQIHVREGRPSDMIHFRLGRSCPHWSPRRQSDGKQPYLMLLEINNPLDDDDDDEPEKFLEIKYNNRRHEWWIDVPRSQLGRPGETVKCCVFTTMNGEDQRGARYGDFLVAKGRSAISWSGVTAWDLVP